MEEREEVGVGDAGDILQNVAVFLEVELGTQTYSPMSLCENQQNVYRTVFVKDNEKKKGKNKGMTQINTSKKRLRRSKKCGSLHFLKCTKYRLCITGIIDCHNKIDLTSI